LTEQDPGPGKTKPRASLGPFSVAVPRSRTLRVILGVALVLGGMVGFLPILGFWMIPLGLIVLSIDFHPIRRLRRRAEVWWAKRRRKKANP
jgi:purine-cytosine permease-like protein